MGTGSPPYTNPLRPKVTIKTINGEDTLYTFDAFSGSNDIGLANITAENAVGENGTFDLVINDHNNEIPKDNIHTVKVQIEFGKTNTSFQQFLIGYGKIFEVDRPVTNAQYYNLSGFGSKNWLYKLYIHRREIYDSDESDAKISNILKNAFTKRLWRPLKQYDKSIEDITGISPDGISSKLKTPYTVIDRPFTYYGDFADELTDIIGAVWFVDFSKTGEEKLTATFNPDLHTKIIIKSGDLQDKVNDNANRISYIKKAWKLRDEATGDAGEATRLITSTVQDEVEMFAIEKTGGSTPLNNQALGQQVQIDNDARRIESVKVKLKIVGEPASPNSRVNGGIFLDKNNKPNMTYTLDEFHIDLGSIDETPKYITVPVDIDPKKLDTVQAKFWIVLFQRSGITGDPTDDPDNTVAFYHNNSFGATQILDGVTLRSGKATGGDFNSKSKLSWQVTDQGPLFNVKVNSNIRRLFSRTNARAASKQLLTEEFIPTDFLNTRKAGEVSRYLSFQLAKTSKMRRSIADFKVTIPTNFLFRPYQWVSFNDGLSGLSDTLQVQRARYTCSAAGDDENPPMGTLHANITLGGLYNTLLGACSCV